MISQKAKYALRALLSLAKADGGYPVQISDIAREQAIPKKFLEQILLEMKKERLVESRRGKQGGYLLARPADDITFGEVLRLIDGPIAPLPCLSKIAYRRCADCQDEASCEIRHVFAHVVNAQREVLEAPILSGRGFTTADAIGGARVAIVDRGFVEQVLQGRNAVGQQVRFRYPGPPSRRWGGGSSMSASAGRTLTVSTPR